MISLKNMSMIVLFGGFVFLNNCMAMDVDIIDKKLSSLQQKKSNILDAAKKRAGGDSTMAYRAILKGKEKELNSIHSDIQALEKIKKGLQELNQKVVQHDNQSSLKQDKIVPSIGSSEALQSYWDGLHESKL